MAETPTATHHLCFDRGMLCKGNAADTAFFVSGKIGRIVLKESGQQNQDVYKRQELSFVCLRPDGAFEAPSTVGIMCRTARKKVEGLEDFHFHMLRHTYTSNLLSNGAAPKDVQELLGHADVSTTMNIYAHATREAKRTSARLLDKVIGGE